MTQACKRKDRNKGIDWMDFPMIRVRDTGSL